WAPMQLCSSVGEPDPLSHLMASFLLLMRQAKKEARYTFDRWTSSRRHRFQERRGPVVSSFLPTDNGSLSLHEASSRKFPLTEAPLSLFLMPRTIEAAPGAKTEKSSSLPRRYHHYFASLRPVEHRNRSRHWTGMPARFRTDGHRHSREVMPYCLQSVQT